MQDDQGQEIEKFTLNGKVRDLPMGQKPTLRQLCLEMGVGDRGYAVEVNQAIVPRSQHASTEVHAGDVVEIVHMVGGG